MAPNRGPKPTATSHEAKGNKQPFDPNIAVTRLHSQLSHNAPVSTAKILSRSDPTSGTVTYTLEIGSVKIPSVSASEVFDYVSPRDLEVFENASFRLEIAAQESAARTQAAAGKPVRRGPGRPRRQVRSSESDDSRDARGEDARGVTSLLGGRRPRPNYTHFYPKQRAQRGAARRDVSVQVVVDSRDRGGFVRPDIPASNAASPVSRGSGGRHKRQKRDGSSSSAAGSVYSVATPPVQQSVLVKAANRVTSKVPESQSSTDVEMIEAPHNASLPDRATARGGKAKLSQSPAEVETAEILSAAHSSSETSTDGNGKGEGEARARVALSESPMDVDEVPRTIAPMFRKPSGSKAKAALASNNPGTSTTGKRALPWLPDIARVHEAKDRASNTSSATTSKAKAALASKAPASQAEPHAASASKAKARASETPWASAFRNEHKGPEAIPAPNPTSVPQPSKASTTPRAAFEAALRANTKPTPKPEPSQEKGVAARALSQLSSHPSGASPSKAAPSKPPAPPVPSSKPPPPADERNSPPEGAEDEDGTYQVERILTHQLSDPRTHRSYGPLPVMLYQVKWVDSDELTWEPASSFDDKDILKEYRKSTTR